MKVAALITVSAVFGLFLALTALKTAWIVAEKSLARQEAILEIN